MKRFFYLLVIPLLLVGCQEMTSELDDIKSRLAALFPYELGTARRKLHQHFIGSSPRFLLTDDPEAPSEERKTVTTVIRSVGPKDKLPVV